MECIILAFCLFSIDQLFKIFTILIQLLAAAQGLVLCAEAGPIDHPRQNPLSSARTRYLH